MKIEINIKNVTVEEFDMDLEQLYESIEQICVKYDIVDNVNIG